MERKRYKYPTARAAKRAAAEQREKYSREKLVAYTFRLRKKEDADIIVKLNNCENKTDYLRELIRAEITKGE